MTHPTAIIDFETYNRMVMAAEEVVTLKATVSKLNETISELEKKLEDAEGASDSEDESSSDSSSDDDVEYYKTEYFAILKFLANDLPRLKEDHLRKIEDLNNKHAAKLDEQNDTITYITNENKSLKEQVAKHLRTISELETEIKNATNIPDNTMDNITNTKHAAEIEELQVARDNKIMFLELDHRFALEAMDKENKSLQAIVDKQGEKIRALEHLGGDNDIDTPDDKIDELACRHREEIDKINTKHKNEITLNNLNFGLRLSTYGKEIGELSKQVGNLIREKEDLEVKCARLRREAKRAADNDTKSAMLIELLKTIQASTKDFK